MEDEVLNPPPPPPISFVYVQVFTYKENLGIQSIRIHQKSSNLAMSHLFAYSTRVEVWDNMTSLQ